MKSDMTFDNVFQFRNTLNLVVINNCSLNVNSDWQTENECFHKFSKSTLIS